MDSQQQKKRADLLMTYIHTYLPTYTYINIQVILHYFHRMPATPFLHRFHHLFSSAYDNDDDDVGANRGGGLHSLEDRLALTRLLDEGEKKGRGSGGGIRKDLATKVTNGMYVRDMFVLFMSYLYRTSCTHVRLDNDRHD